MRKAFTYGLWSILLLSSMCISTLSLQAGNGGSQINRPSNMGEDFYLTFIPAYLESGNNRIMLYIAAMDTGTATIEIPSMNYLTQVHLIANGIVPVMLTPDLAQATMKSPNQTIPPEHVWS